MVVDGVISYITNRISLIHLPNHKNNLGTVNQGLSLYYLIKQIVGDGVLSCVTNRISLIRLPNHKKQPRNC